MSLFPTWAGYWLSTATRFERITQTGHYEELEQIDQQVVLFSQELKQSGSA